MPPGSPHWATSEKPKNLWRTLWTLFLYIGEYKWHIVGGIVFSLLASLAAIVAPQYLSTMTNAISDGIGTGEIDMDSIAGAGLVLIVLYLINMLFSTLQSYIVPSASERNGNTMRRDLAAKIFRIPLRILDRMSTGDVMSRFTNDTDTIRTQSAECICDSFSALTMMIGSMVMMLATNVDLALISVVPVALGFAMMIAIVRSSQGYFVSQARSLGQMNALVEELYYGMDVVNTYNDRDRAMNRFEEINESLYKSAFRTRFVSSLMPRIMDFIMNLGYVLVCVFGSIRRA